MKSCERTARGSWPALLSVSLALAVVPPAGAQPLVDDPLARVHSSDPLELARVVDRLGDDAVLDRLGAQGVALGTLDPAVVVAAVRASPWLHAPERALPRLVEIASSSDPELAPAAMLALVRIAERLDRASLDAREADDAPLREAIPALERLGADGAARRDLRGAALRARELLRVLVSSDG